MAAMMLTIVIVGFGGMFIWAFYNDGLKEYFIVVGGIVALYLFFFLGFEWIRRGE
jgi:hypothetical protein